MCISTLPRTCASNVKPSAPIVTLHTGPHNVHAQPPQYTAATKLSLSSDSQACEECTAVRLTVSKGWLVVTSHWRGRRTFCALASHMCACVVKSRIHEDFFTGKVTAEWTDADRFPSDPGPGPLQGGGHCRIHPCTGRIQVQDAALPSPWFSGIRSQ